MNEKTQIRAIDLLPTPESLPKIAYLLNCVNNYAKINKMVAEPLDPEKFHTVENLPNKKKRYLLALVLIVIFVLIPVSALSYYKVAVNRPAQSADEKTIKIESGESISSISARLFAEDIVNSEFLFKTYVVINNLQNDIQAGTYKIPAGMSAAQVADLLQHGTNDKTITFLEGWRMEEFANAASINFDKVDYTNFVFAANNSEGYLFPDTYEFDADVTEQEMLDTLRNTFELKTKDVLTEEALIKVGLTKEEAVIFASIVEREINNEEDKPVVAGILIKRWQEGMKLDADATTQYAIAPGRYGCGSTPIAEYDITPDTNDDRVVCPDEEDIPNVNWWPNDLTVTELANESEFNTRKNVGLPPKPISYPGLSSIEAVLNYEESDYYYYLNDASGKTYFAKTLAEHELNVAKFL